MYGTYGLKAERLINDFINAVSPQLSPKDCRWLEACAQEFIHERPLPERSNTRKVIQIESFVKTNGLAGALYTLCDDGTMWIKTSSQIDGDSPWREIENVPQPE